MLAATTQTNSCYSLIIQFIIFLNIFYDRVWAIIDKILTITRTEHCLCWPKSWNDVLFCLLTTNHSEARWHTYAGTRTGINFNLNQFFRVEKRNENAIIISLGAFFYWCRISNLKTTVKENLINFAILQ